MQEFLQFFILVLSQAPVMSLGGSPKQHCMKGGGQLNMKPLYSSKRKSAAEYLQDSGAGLDTVEKWKPACFCQEIERKNKTGNYV
jgi:hypothetical protein